MCQSVRGILSEALKQGNFGHLLFLVDQERMRPASDFPRMDSVLCVYFSALTLLVWQ